MSSRMEKYYKAEEQVSKRSQKNQDLYRNIYDAKEYSNIAAVATLERTNEIDITKVKNMLKNREDYKRQKSYRQFIKDEEIEKEKPKEDFMQEKNYDIREILEKARNKKTDTKDYRSLDNTNYNILKELKIKPTNKNKLDEEESKELKELINTITSTSLLNKLDDEELSINMFDDLKDGTTEIDEKANKAKVQALLEEAKALDAKKEKNSRDPEIDNSFYTSSLNFDKKDFEELYDSNKKQKMKKSTVIAVITIIIVVISIIGLLIYQFLH